MAGGQWTQWGSPHKGGCEGYSLEIGIAFVGSVVRYELPGSPTTWMCSINTRHLGQYPERELAMRRVEEIIEHDMKSVLYDWHEYQEAKRSKG